MEDYIPQPPPRQVTGEGGHAVPSKRAATSTVINVLEEFIAICEAQGVENVSIADLKLEVAREKAARDNHPSTGTSEPQ